MRLALGISYNGQAYQGWQSQLSRQTVQDQLEAALGKFSNQSVSTLCAGRTDAGVHALMQVVHFDTALDREHLQAQLKELREELKELREQVRGLLGQERK